MGEAGASAARLALAESFRYRDWPTSRFDGQPEGGGRQGLWDGRKVALLTVRYAMLFYVLKRLGLLGDAAKETPDASTL